MNAAAITSTASAVHQELIRALAERARIHRLRDQRKCLRGQPQRARFGTGGNLSASHEDPGARANPPIVLCLPDALSSSFGPIGLDSPTDHAGPAGLAALRTPTGPA
jgi:hypothetical protein